MGSGTGESDPIQWRTKRYSCETRKRAFNRSALILLLPIPRSSLQGALLHNSLFVCTSSPSPPAAPSQDPSQRILPSDSAMMSERSAWCRGLLFQHIHNRDHLQHVGDSHLFEGHAVMCGVVDAHRPFGFHSRVSCCASAIWAGVICLARSLRYPVAISYPFPAAKLYHM